MPMNCLYVKLAWRNVRRSVKDYSIYFLTLAFASCLLYSFTASGDYLLALDLTEEQRGIYGSASMVTQAFSVFSVVVFVYLVVYANRFILRRRSNEFAVYGLLGMKPSRVMSVLIYESTFLGAAAFVAGIAVGVLLSPAFGGVAAFVFGVPWKFALTFSPGALLWTTGCFVAIMIGAMLLGTRTLRKQSLGQLMNAGRSPEKPKAASRLSLGVQGILAIVALGIVWGLCLVQPITFIVWILPLGVAAVFATGMLFRVQAIRAARRSARHSDRYLVGLRCFVVRQMEAKISATSSAMGCTCVLVAVAICMMVAGLAFSVGMRGSGTSAGAASALAPLGYVGIFYGLTFLVAAAAVLALQQLAEGADSISRFRVLSQLGCDRRLMRRAVWLQAGVYFAVPLAFALVHCVFGLALVGFLAATLGSSSFVAIVAGTIGVTVALLGSYYVFTARASERMLLGTS